MKLRRFWFEFRRDAELPLGLGYGCGVTAYDLADAMRFLRDRIFGGAEPPIARRIDDVDVSTLDPGHVLPNMMPPSNRGIWFPIGYSD